MAKKKNDIIDRYIAFIKKLLKEKGDEGGKKSKIPIVLEKRRRLLQMRHSEFYMGKVVRKNDIT